MLMLCSEAVKRVFDAVKRVQESRHSLLPRRLEVMSSWRFQKYCEAQSSG